MSIETTPKTALASTDAGVAFPLAAIASPPTWTIYQKIAFRIGFIYVVLLCFPSGIFSLPPDFGWFARWFTLDWTSLHYRDLYEIARFSPSFPLVSGWLSLPRLEGHSIWIVLLVISVVGGLVWTLIDRKRRSYNLLYYWSLVLVRYRAGIGIIGFGFTKLLPVQMPYPSEGLLNTDFGDFTGQKIYWLSIGIVPWYQIFTGIVEVFAGTLLFFRQTSVFGAALLFGALGSITLVNHVYDGGVQSYAFYFVLLGVYVFAYYVPRVYRLLILQQYVITVDYWPTFPKKWQKTVRYGIKAAILFLFLGVLFYLQLNNFLYDPYKQPSTPGVAKLRGYYDVTEFKINGQEILYSPLDTVRWQEVTFEKWSTLTYKVNRATLLDLSNGGGNPIRDIDRTFEITGTAGGRRVFHYYADTMENTLYLQDKVRRDDPFAGLGEAGPRRGGRDAARQPLSATVAQDTSGHPASSANQGLSDPWGPYWISAQAWKNIGDENTKIDPRGATARRAKEFEREPRPADRKKMLLTYDTKDGNTVVLKGINENRDSLYIVLERLDRNYLLTRSTLDAGQYN